MSFSDIYSSYEQSTTTRISAGGRNSFRSCFREGGSISPASNACFLFSLRRSLSNLLIEGKRNKYFIIFVQGEAILNIGLLEIMTADTTSKRGWRVHIFELQPNNTVCKDMFTTG